MGYQAFDDPYLYRGTAVLRNRLGLLDKGDLEAFEVEASTIRSLEPLPAGRLTPTHYSAVHHHLFQDVYRWAGRYRTVRIAKGDSMFCYPEYIPAEMTKLFASLRKRHHLRGLGDADFALRAAEFLSELNAIHPFREGNGRSQLSLLFLVANAAGHPLALRRLDRRTFLPAMVMSFNGSVGPLAAELQSLL